MSNEQRGRSVAVRQPLNLAELVQAGLIEMTEVAIADADTMIAVEVEMAEQLAALEASDVPMAEARQRLLGYAVEPGTGDLHDFVERRLVREYLLATGVDAVAVPMTREAPLYSHVARDASLVAIAGDLAPEAIVERLTSCPRVLLYGMDADGLALKGTLFRRVAAISAAGWPGRGRWVTEGPSAATPSDLLALVRAIERGQRPVRTEQAVKQPESAAEAEAPRRRRPRHIRLTGDEPTP